MFCVACFHECGYLCVSLSVDICVYLYLWRLARACQCACVRVRVRVRVHLRLRLRLCLRGRVGDNRFVRCPYLSLPVLVSIFFVSLSLLVCVCRYLGFCYEQI